MNIFSGFKRSKRRTLVISLILSTLILTSVSYTCLNIQPTLAQSAGSKAAAEAAKLLEERKKAAAKLLEERKKAAAKLLEERQKAAAKLAAERLKAKEAAEKAAEEAAKKKKGTSPAPTPPSPTPPPAPAPAPTPTPPTPPTPPSPPAPPAPPSPPAPPAPPTPTPPPPPPAPAPSPAPPPSSGVNVPVPNNGGDSTGAINTAIATAVQNGGGNVTFPAGTYDFSSAITIPNGVNFVGASASSVTLNPTQNGACLIVQGTSGLSNFTLNPQPGDNYSLGYVNTTQDPNPTLRGIYGAPGANLGVGNVSLSSLDGTDCSSLNIQSCSITYTLNAFGCQNMTIQNCTFAASALLQVLPDSNQNQSVGLSVLSCTFSLNNYYRNGNIVVGGGSTAGSTQGISGCTFNGGEPMSVTVVNNGSTASTNFSFTNNSFIGITSKATSLTIQNSNPNVTAYVNGNQFHARANTFAISVQETNASQANIGPVIISNNDLTTGIIIGTSASGYGGNLTITNNTFSLGGAIALLDLQNIPWIGPLNVSNNTFTLTGQAFGDYCPIYLVMPPTDSQGLSGPVTVQNNTCTDTVAIPLYILILDPPNATTNLSGNKITPAGAIVAAVHTIDDMEAILAPLQ